MEIVLVLAHVLRQVTDARREYRDLDLRRPCVTSVGRILAHYLFFVLYYRQLRFSSLIRYSHYSINLFLVTYMLPQASSTLANDPTRLLYIPRYLIFQLLKTREPLLRAQPLDEGD